MNKLNIPFIDGNFLNYIDDDSEYIPGSCPTCDYGAQYINEFNIYTTNYKIRFYYAFGNDLYFTEGGLLQILLGIDIRRISENEFIDMFSKNLKEYVMKNIWCSRSNPQKTFEDLIEEEILYYTIIHN